MKVLYEDNHLIVAVKPPMVPTQPDSSGDADMLGMVREYVRCRYHKQGSVYIGLLHRLDRPVGGVMVFARTSKAASRLSEQIRSGGMEKEYLAVVHGCPPEEGLFEDYLIKDASRNLVKPVREGIRPAGICVGGAAGQTQLGAYPPAYRQTTSDSGAIRFPWLSAVGRCPLWKRRARAHCPLFDAHCF